MGSPIEPGNFVSQLYANLVPAQFLHVLLDVNLCKKIRSTFAEVSYNDIKFDLIFLHQLASNKTCKNCAPSSNFQKTVWMTIVHLSRVCMLRCITCIINIHTLLQKFAYPCETRFCLALWRHHLQVWFIQMAL